MTKLRDLIPAPIRLLWEDAMDFIADMLEQFDREGLRAGIRRSSGVRLSIWLGDVESALRRLILMAALALTPAPLKPRVAQTPTPRASVARVPSFRVFRLHGTGAARASQPSAWRPAQAPAPYGHIRFPSDPILALARMPVRRPTHRHNGGPLLPRPTPRNPLDRWGRLSRNDPDWRAPEPVFNPLAYRVITDAKRRQRAKPQRLDSTADWRRCYDEWEKLVPAPHLAARLDALARAMAHPDRLIRRTSRRLQSQRERTLALARAAWPATDLPRRARQVQASSITPNTAISAHRAFDSS
jgi:hypothetical protein